MTIKELNEKFKTGNYICVVKNRFGPEGYFIKESPEFKENWEYKLIHKKHKEVLQAYLKDNSVEILSDAYSDNARDMHSIADYFPNENFIDLYNDNYSWKINDK